MTNLHTLRINTGKKEQFIDLTRDITHLIKESGISEGVCHIYVPHTTAGVTINEGHDPSVIHDILMHLNKLVPDDGGYTHLEGNSDAHIKAFLAGTEKTVLVSGGEILLGNWQRIFFCEFDGPRQRKVLIRISVQ
ncbi:secondary thiamine-phosphate synthase enzyme YjbQ [Desulfallas thermosapovorans]|uniref:Secondary thiamine-phosphate synthase enzyme n=1 Tax=Desulfallas thermosapovorans DSM 6562 TaxID=1121431 RepID=A0A5S4ZQW9_9FIRM|nr:secondary thiamine-phosphate synthase enzyme YjbQ [Desulfallas thermosapovorans]TYO95000.1 secondary thiamine-phosphate synthase enzyme [Desulfallas thermosapovorans DSM 6562]